MEEVVEDLMTCLGEGCEIWVHLVTEMRVKLFKKGKFVHLRGYMEYYFDFNSLSPRCIQ